ncbi:unnamed protein product, partial [Didymodactylos carnosus]
KYRSWVQLDTEKSVPIADVYSSTASDAKRRAASRALEWLMKREPEHILRTKPLVANTEYDEMANTVGDFIKHIRSSESAPEILRSLDKQYYAAFVLKRTSKDTGKVVAFGIGNRCPDPDHVTEGGETLLDCHALTLARRALIQYLYGELHYCLQDSSVTKIRSIFEYADDSLTKFQIKKNVTLHLCLSDSPNGDARDYLPADTNSEMNSMQVVQMRTAGHAPEFSQPEHGSLKYKLSTGMDTIIADPIQRYAIMSCSDKILKWNVLGIQGALLSNIIEPFKISSITFLSGYKLEHTCRALCCRLQNASIETCMLSSYYTFVNYLGRMKYPLVPEKTIESNFSYSWSLAYQGEVIDAVRGKPVTGGMSLLSKLQLFIEYKSISHQLRRMVSIDSTYYIQKQAAKTYQQKKLAMKNYLERQKMGYWSFQKKHLEQFKIQSTVSGIVRNIMC